MNVIPVIDLLDNQVVHAVRGDRKNYKPIQSTLCTGSDFISVLNGLLTLYRFKAFYIADINAIQGSGSHTDFIKHVIQEYSEIDFWVDAGFTKPDSVINMRRAGAKIVLGSESMENLAHYQNLLNAAGEESILSLDFRSKKFQGPIELLEYSKLWPANTIVMTLSQVGSLLGPDLDQLLTIKKYCPTIDIYAAGGVRQIEDIHMLESNGISGALVASALHNGAISDLDLTSLKG